MTITRKEIDRMRSDGRMRIDRDLEVLILERYGVEPDGPEYTDQDLYEQIRKLVNEYNREHLDPKPADPRRPWIRTNAQPQKPTTHKEAKTSK
jgi:hypothetical protein